jgi:hypothetical protein
MGDGIVATIQTPIAKVGFDSNRSRNGISLSAIATLRLPIRLNGDTVRLFTRRRYNRGQARTRLAHELLHVL